LSPLAAVFQLSPITAAVSELGVVVALPVDACVTLKMKLETRIVLLLLPTAVYHWLNSVQTNMLNALRAPAAPTVKSFSEVPIRVRSTTSGLFLRVLKGLASLTTGTYT